MFADTGAIVRGRRMFDVHGYVVERSDARAASQASDCLTENQTTA
jgi:hypothetical protein